MNNEIIKISTDNEGHYNIFVEKDTSVEEVLFAITVVLKCFDRDKVISKENSMELINRYLNDVQYEEVMDGGLA